MYIFICFSLIIGYIIYDFINKYFSPLYDIPSPFEWPVLGHMPYFILVKDQIGLFNKWAEDFKENGTSKYLVVMIKPEYQKLVLSLPEKYVRPPFFPTYFPLTGQSLLNAQGSHHRFQKKLLGKAFSVGQMKHYIPIFDQHAAVLVKVWKSLVQHCPHGKNLEVKSYFNNLSFDIIGEVGFAYNFNSQTSTVNPFVSSFREQTEGVCSYTSRMILKYLPVLWYLPFGPAKTIKDSNAAAEKVLQMVIDRRKEKISAGTLTEQEKNDVLSIMMTEKDEKTGQMFSEQLIKDNVYTFFMAGHETTATSLPGVLYYLAKFPEHQDKCRKEIQDFIGKGEVLNLDLLSKLIFTSAFIKECLRLFNVIPINGRITSEDVIVGTYCIPKDTQIFCLGMTANTDEDYFDDAKSFLPERYLDETLVKTGTSFTFGYGPYNCIGKNLAIFEMKVVMVRLLQHFRFTIDPEHDQFTCTVPLTLKVEPPLQIRVLML